MDAGEGLDGEGEPIAFLNGVLMTVDSWKLQTHEISLRFRCVMHDFRGQLRSSKPDEPWSLEDHARDLVALLDHLVVGDGSSVSFAERGLL